MSPEVSVLVKELEKKVAADIAEMIPQALELAAKASATPIDDVIVAALKEPLKKALQDLIGQI